MKHIFFILISFFHVSMLYAQDTPLQQLKQHTLGKIQAEMQKADGILGIAAKDLRSGESILINEKQLFPTGSSIKIAILLEIANQIADKKYAWRDTLQIRKKDQALGSGVLQFFDDRVSSLGISDLATLMITLSDNTATNLLIKKAGMANINQTLSKLGIQDLKLQRIMLDQAASVAGRENIASPFVAMTLMEKLYKKEGIRAEVSEKVLSFLKLPKTSNLTQLLPVGTVVASKPGGIEGASCEWGVVYLPHGAYSIAIMSSYNVGTSSDVAMAQISKIVYDYFERISRATPYGNRVPATLLKN